MIAIDIIKTQSESGERNFNKNGDDVNTSIEIRFMWMPGIKPVNIPEVTPQIIASNI